MWAGGAIIAIGTALALVPGTRRVPDRARVRVARRRAAAA